MLPIYSLLHFYVRTSICISTCSPAALPPLPFVLTASQSNSSLKKQRSRSIFSTFFCCFRNYNVEPPPPNTNTSSLPPPVEENGSPPKVGCSSTNHILCDCYFSLSSWTLLVSFLCSLSYPSPCFCMSVCISLVS